MNDVPAQAATESIVFVIILFPLNSFVIFFIVAFHFESFNFFYCTEHLCRVWKICERESVKIFFMENEMKDER